MSRVLNDEIFNALLYVSRLEADGKDREVLKAQISSIVSYFDELAKFKNEEIADDKLQYNTERDLRPASLGSDSEKLFQLSCLEQKMLKAMNEEFMDGYFRTPKVLGSC